MYAQKSILCFYTHKEVVVVKRINVSVPDEFVGLAHTVVPGIVECPPSSRPTV